MALTPKIFLGKASEPALLLLGGAYTDDGTKYEMLARTRRVALAGAGGEAIFTTLYIATTHYEQNVSLWVTPYVDGVALATQQINLVGVPGTKGETKTHELGLSQSYMVGGTERLRTSPRGTWFEVQVETKYQTSGLTPAKQVVDGIEIEHEIVRESMVAVA